MLFHVPLKWGEGKIGNSGVGADIFPPPSFSRTSHRAHAINQISSTAEKNSACSRDTNA
jgi:hypothetical protein